MRLKQTPSALSHRRNFAPRLVCLAVAVLIIEPGLVGLGAQTDRKVRLSVQDPRPLAKAVQELENRSGVAVTYEDPFYVNEGEVADVTRDVRRDLNRLRPVEAPKVLIPRGGAVTVDYSAIPGTDRPADPLTVVQQLVREHSASGNAGLFRVEDDGRMIHVVPTAFKNREGLITAQESVLDALITVPEEERSGVRTLQAICEAVSRATNVRVVMGVIPLNLLLQHRGREGGENQKARDMLVNLLENSKRGTNLSWRLLYDPGMGIYVLNIRVVPAIR